MISSWGDFRDGDVFENSCVAMVNKQIKMEPETPQTVLDAIERQLETLHARSFVLRVAYCGWHDVGDPEKNVGEFFEDAIKRINSGYCDVTIGGFVLVYPNHFVALVEGSEDTIARQIVSIVDSGGMFEKLKLLAVYHNVEKRFFSSWRSFFTDPPNTDSKIENVSSNREMEIVVSKCMEKVHNLAATFVNNPETILMGDISQDIKNQAFPEISLIDNILSSPHIMDLKDYSNMYMTLPEYTYTFEECWPAPFDFTPTLEEKSQLDTVYFPPLKEIMEKCTRETNGESSQSEPDKGRVEK